MVSPLLSAALEAASPLRSRLDFAALLHDHARLLQVRTALPELALIPERLVGFERVNASGLMGFGVTLDALSTSAHFELKALIGEQITVRWLLPTDGYRALHGYVVQAEQLGGEGGLARYRLQLAPFTALMNLQRDARIFQDQDARQIIEARLSLLTQARWRWDATATLAPRSRCTQYRETTAAFIERLLREEGLSWHFEQDADGASPDNEKQARHTLVIRDADPARSPRASLGRVRFTAQHPTATLRDLGHKDTITAFASAAQLAPNAVTLGSWDHKRLHGLSAQAHAEGALPLEHYAGDGAYRYKDGDMAQARADQALAALQLGAARHLGQGGLRVLAAGVDIELADHFSANARYTVLSVEHRAANNLGSALARLHKDPELEHGSYRNAFSAVPATMALTPHWAPRPAAQAQVARVVGLPDGVVHTDRDARVKVQFAWQRGERPNPGGHLLDDANAPGDDRSGTWVRVASALAGPNWGQLFTPRVGSEVLVDFIDGDIDRPVVTGQLYSEAHLPVWSAGENSGANHPGHLSGFRSQGHDGQDHNHWVMDDSPGQLRTRLASSHASAELSLGDLINHNPLASQRGGWRGMGVELATQGWGSLRAPQGLLLSTQARAQAQGTQMDSAEALAQLRAAQDLGQRLNSAAAPAGAQALSQHDSGQAWTKLTQDLDPKQDGKHPDTVSGQDSRQPQAGSRTPQDPTPRTAKPHLVLDSAASLAAVTPGDYASLAGQHHSRTTQGDQHETAAHTHHQLTGEHFSLYAHAGQLQMKAAAGPVSLQAHTDALEILADQSLQILSVNDEIHILAKDSITLTGGDSSITLKGGDIEVKTSGTFEVKTATHEFLGGGSNPAELEALPNAKLNEEPAFMELNLHDEWLQPVAGAPYVVVFEDGTRREGKLDANGHARLEGIPNQMARVYYGEDPRAPEARVEMPVNTFKASATTNEEAIANIERAELEAERYWAEQATNEQREVRAELNDAGIDNDGENAWHFLDEGQQRALRAKIMGSDA